ncbi:distal tail protein Dit [Enterococcus sp. AZ101]|uniref:distal tail protein Dit n=1 Tax=Enterococcus sp. AZ101 TaxID=2774742 RepID=UPI003D26E621
MYDFKSILEIMELPQKAMTYDGKYLENQIPGYLTLDVAGRESLDTDIQTDEIHVGSIISNQKLKSKTLIVEYGLTFENYEDSQFKFNKIKQFLFRREDVPIVFNDENGILFYGRLSLMQQPTYHTNEFATGKIELFCQNPLKHSRIKEFSNVITMDSPIETTPKKIIVKLSTNSSIKITNKRSGAKIKITSAAIYSDNLVEFDFEHGKVFVNGADRTAILDLDSDFENFYIHRGDEIICNNGVMTIYANEVYL